MGGMCSICLRPGKESSCCCFNLAIAILVFACYYGLVGGMDLWQAMNSDPEPVNQKYNAIFAISVSGALALSVFLGFLRLGLISFLFTLAVFLLQLTDAIFKLVSFVMNWIDWGAGLSDGTIKFQAAMITSSISQLLTIGVACSIANIMYSAALVYKEGGNGCEYKTYKEIQAQKQKAADKKQDEQETTEEV